MARLFAVAAGASLVAAVLVVASITLGL